MLSCKIHLIYGDTKIFYILIRIQIYKYNIKKIKLFNKEIYTL